MFTDIDLAKPQTSNMLVRVMADHFHINGQTMRDNTFMQHSGGISTGMAGFNEMEEAADIFDAAGVGTVDFHGLNNVPDGVFPNNWFATFMVGDREVCALYPMRWDSRMREKRQDMIEGLTAHFGAENILDLSAFEEIGKALEGTGVLVPARDDGVYFACKSERMHEDVLRVFIDQMNKLELVEQLKTLEDQYPQLSPIIKQHNNFKLPQKNDKAPVEAYLSMIEQVSFLEILQKQVEAALPEQALAELSWDTNPEKQKHRSVTFTSSMPGPDSALHDIYHTNVMMCMGSKAAVICMDSIENPHERAAVAAELEDLRRETIAISRGQVSEMAGNMLAVTNGSGQEAIVMSARARASLETAQLEQMERNFPGGMIVVPLETLELAGGSIRCTLAEVMVKDPAAFARTMAEHAPDTIHPSPALIRAWEEAGVQLQGNTPPAFSENARLESGAKDAALSIAAENARPVPDTPFMDITKGTKMQDYIAAMEPEQRIQQPRLDMGTVERQRDHNKSAAVR